MSHLDSGQAGHGAEDPPNPGSCAAAHPIIDDLSCQRLHGHPGEHRAHMDAPSAEMILEWQDGDSAAATS